MIRRIRRIRVRFPPKPRRSNIAVMTWTPPVVQSLGGLHHITQGMGDTGEGARVPQTLHTIEQGICV